MHCEDNQSALSRGSQCLDFILSFLLLTHLQLIFVWDTDVYVLLSHNLMKASTQNVLVSYNIFNIIAPDSEHLGLVFLLHTVILTFESRGQLFPITTYSSLYEIKQNP